MTPAMPPLPTASYFRFHWPGSHSSKLSSGSTAPATRQNAGTLRAGAPGAALGSINEPAGTFAADLIAMPGSESLVRLSQDGCATAGIAARDRARIAYLNMDDTPPGWALWCHEEVLVVNLVYTTWLIRPWPKRRPRPSI